MLGAAVFSSSRSHWRTPPDLFARLHAEFHFTLDVCATHETRLTDRYIGPDHVDENLRDALNCSWGVNEVCFMNPPYSRDDGIAIDPFVEKARLESVWNNVVVGLIPARTDTRWWHASVMKADEIRLIPHRVVFCLPDGTPGSSAPFPSAVVIWRPRFGVVGRATRFVTWDYR